MMTMSFAAAYARRWSQSGGQVTEAENGQIAVEAITAARPDVIILDLMMPKMDGF
jgi:two-component system response regulator TrcR